MPSRKCAPWCVLALLCLLGCGGGATTYSAGGRVTYPDGSPVEGGAVEFRSLETEKPVGARGVIQADGTFQLTTYEPEDGAVPGRHQVLIVSKRPSRDEWVALQRAGKLKAVHPKYQRFDSSGLELTVTENPAENDFQITVDLLDTNGSQ